MSALQTDQRGVCYVLQRKKPFCSLRRPRRFGSLVSSPRIAQELTAVCCSAAMVERCNWSREVLVRTQSKTCSRAPTQCRDGCAHARPRALAQARAPAGRRRWNAGCGCRVASRLSTIWRLLVATSNCYTANHGTANLIGPFVWTRTWGQERGHGLSAQRSGAKRHRHTGAPQRAWHAAPDHPGGDGPLQIRRAGLQKPKAQGRGGCSAGKGATLGGFFFAPKTRKNRIRAACALSPNSTAETRQ